MRVNHSKYKNTGILFELLIRQITTDTLENNPSPARKLLHKYFVKTELGREYKLYETISKNVNLTESKSNIILTSLLETSKTLNRGALKRQKYNLISEIQKHYNLNEFFNHKIPNYKPYASLYTLIELNNSNSPDTNQIIQNKVTLMEHLISSSSSSNKIKNEILEEIRNSDKDIKLLTYKILLEKFNEKYGNLSDSQKVILREYLNSIDNNVKLKEFYNSNILEISKNLKTQLNGINDGVTKIKLEEILNIIKPLTKEEKIKDNHLVNLLQYCDLIQEIEKANATI
jgi:hypothetical protein